MFDSGEVMPSTEVITIEGEYRDTLHVGEWTRAR